MVTTKAQFKNFRITATFKGDKKASWNNLNNWNNHIVTVYNTETKKRTSFDFWASLNKPQITESVEALEAFDCFVSDAIAGEMDFIEFCEEFGYSSRLRETEKTWKACVDAHKRLIRISDIDIYDLANELREHLESLY